MDLTSARALMHEWVSSPALRAHMEAVSACMGAYAEKLEPGEAERWRIAGLLHDFDYEKHPTAEEHPVVGVKHLETLGVDREILDAILGHAFERTGVARTTKMAKALFACDELAGFIVACGKVRPDGLKSLEPKSVTKKLKTASFAANVSRGDIALGIAELREVVGAELAEDAHIAACIGAIRASGEL